MEQMSFFLAATIRMAAPLLLAALGLAIAERSGIINIGGEGIMLTGAFAAYAAAKITGSYWTGITVAMMAGIIMISIFAFATVKLRAEQVVVGAGMNILCAGLTSVVYRRIFYRGAFLEGGTTVISFPVREIPWLSDIPLIGPMLFQHNVIVYFTFLMVGVLWFILFRTSLGLRIIAVGEHPRAADSLGIRVTRIRFLAVLFSGALMGIAGGYLSIAQSNAFAENMTSGRGFIALAVVILGKWNPIGIFIGAILFGGAIALQMSIQNLGMSIPNNAIMMIPYIATVVAVFAVSKHKVGAPSALGVPYEKGA